MGCSFLSALAEASEPEGGFFVEEVEGVDDAVACGEVDDCDDSEVLPAAGATTFEDLGGLKYRPPGGLEEKKE